MVVNSDRENNLGELLILRAMQPRGGIRLLPSWPIQDDWTSIPWRNEKESPFVTFVGNLKPLWLSIQSDRRESRLNVLSIYDSTQVIGSASGQHKSLALSDKCYKITLGVRHHLGRWELKYIRKHWQRNNRKGNKISLCKSSDMTHRVVY